MLVLNRKTGERVCIGASVVVTVVAVRNGQVRLAFEASSDVAIDREEVRQCRNGSIPEEQEDSCLIPQGAIRTSARRAAMPDGLPCSRPQEGSGEELQLS